jgi:hypothetical protein
MPVEVIRWEGILEGWWYRAGLFFTSIDVKSELIRAASAVTASASEINDTGEPFLGDTTIIVGAIVPYEGGAQVQIGTSTSSLNPSQVRLAITLTAAHPA